MSRAVIAEITEAAGFRAISTDTVDAALEVLGSTSVRAVVTDIRMPDAEAGLGFIKTVGRGWPDIPITVVTGYPWDLVSIQADNECPVLIIHKPFHVSQLVEALRMAAGTKIMREVCLEL
jgi:DNA-binding NtrC family response regulator